MNNRGSQVWFPGPHWDQVRLACVTLQEWGGSHRGALLSGWPSDVCGGGGVRGGRGRPGMVHGVIRFLHHCGQRWGIVGERVLISRCQGLSAPVMFTPQVCWLLADCSAKASSYQANREPTGSGNRNPPIARCYRLSPPHTLSPQSLLVAFSASRRLILPHLAFRRETAPPLSIHRSGMRSESSLNRPDQDGA
ncbi:unnamed protein product [Pleuronectes platessa]|uniref:Uncharacterized protein n=1 Tax=Pleuronectes platessa TaxID=8262 RepID=A0A9N7UKV9_PLEPL|nr:unnamed protein product [Pleuronectes platessa]